MKNKVKRGRPAKKQNLPGVKITKFTPELVKMDDLSFNEDLFIPMKTGKKIDFNITYKIENQYDLT